MWCGKVQCISKDADTEMPSLRWPALKCAVKYLLNQTFEQWPTTSTLILHPAASLLPSPSSLLDEASTSAPSLNGHADGDDSSSSVGKEGSSANGSLLVENASPNTATAALALSSRFAREGDGSRETTTIKDADLQAFFPSKRRAPAEWNGSWGRRLDTKEAVEEERRTIFSMLDDFEGQPPFTIQRLSELILRPSEHHHTLPKYISALKRLLSVTATRDAFPAYGEEDQDDVAGAGVPGQSINGHATASSIRMRDRATTPVPGSPSTAPLFSPIPFLMKSGDEGMPGKAGADDLMMEDEDVPGMELGGADRTTEGAVEAAKRSGAGAGAGAHQSSARAAAYEGATEGESSNTGDGSEEKAEPIIRPAPEPTPLTSANSAMSSDVTNAGNGPSNNLPLGVPSGRVDELDQLGEKHGQLPPVESGSLGGGAKALSSTTTATTSETSEDDSTMQNEPLRAVKRVRGERTNTGVDEAADETG